MFRAAEKSTVVDDQTGILVQRRGRAEYPDEIPLALHDPSLDKSATRDGYFYFSARILLDKDGNNPFGAELSLINTKIAFAQYTKGDPQAFAQLQEILIEAVTVHLRDIEHIPNPIIRFGR